MCSSVMACLSGFLSRALLCVCVILLLPCSSSGNFQVVGPNALSAVAGEDLVLPCSLKPSMNAEGMTVEWFRLDQTGLRSLVHLYKDRNDANTNQVSSYRGRTSLFKEELRKGNASLLLKQLDVTDSGEYKCLIVSKDYDDIVIKLNVIGTGSQPVIYLDNVDGEGFILVCESSGWNPEPVVDWLDSEGRTLSADPTKWNSDGLTVKRRLVVNKWEKNNNKYICRVSGANKMKETMFHFKDGFYTALKVAVALGLVMICMGIFFVVCYRKKRT
ncbi:butyrophilin subfamily 3 member A2-like isoform X2 [Alosa pseudoharengus]|uniref:butyrophilin subfamily 3 member A2-like isoform X2 n=1 Tax=Alosa pseudoharengus TaxID=34774 RepID=UPI003F8C76CA